MKIIKLILLKQILFYLQITDNDCIPFYLPGTSVLSGSSSSSKSLPESGFFSTLTVAVVSWDA